MKVEEKYATKKSLDKIKKDISILKQGLKAMLKAMKEERKGKEKKKEKKKCK